MLSFLNYRRFAIASSEDAVYEGWEPEPVFVDLLRGPGIDSQPGGPVRNPICRTGPPGYATGAWVCTASLQLCRIAT
jgi:hypothetical protein